MYQVINLFDSNNKIYKFLLLIFMGILGSCAKITKPLDLDLQRMDFTKNLVKLDRWFLQGKLQVVHIEQNKKEVFSCYLDWQKSNTYSIATFRSHFNLKNFTIKFPNKDDLKTQQIEFKEDGQPLTTLAVAVTSKHPESNLITLKLADLLHKGSLNLNDLNYWFLGKVNPNTNYTIGAKGFKQHGWVVSYTEFTELKSDNQVILIPTKLNLEYAGTSLSKPQLKIKFHISSFKLTQIM